MKFIIYYEGDMLSYNKYDIEGGEKELTISQISEVCQNFKKINSDNYEDYLLTVMVYE